MPDSDEVKHLRAENEGLKKELHEATLRLATAAHKEYQVPDGNIKEDFEKICQAIERWIDYASEDEPGDFRNRYKDALRREERYRRLKDLEFEYERPATMDPTLNWLRNLEMLHYYILSLVIRRYIFFGILMKQYPVGTTESQQVAFSSIEEEMIRMGKTKSKKNQWRADTLKALSASKSFKAEKDFQLKGLWDGLRDHLLFWSKNSEASKHKTRLRRDIFDPAVKLHQEMQCSTQQFELVYIRKGTQFDSSLRVNQGSPYNLKEITTWKTMASDGTESKDIFDCIYPGIIAYDQEVEVKSELVKPVMVVYKSPIPPPTKRSTTSSTSSSPHRPGSPIKESREPKHPRPANNPPAKSPGSSIFGNLFSSGVRKTADNTRQSEPTSRTSRRPSHDPTKHSVYPSLSQEEYQSYPHYQLNPPQPQLHSSGPSFSYSMASADGQPSISASNEITVEYDEPEEMSHQSSSPRR